MQLRENNQPHARASMPQYLYAMMSVSLTSYTSIYKGFLINTHFNDNIL